VLRWRHTTLTEKCKLFVICLFLPFLCFVFASDDILDGDEDDGIFVRGDRAGGGPTIRITYPHIGRNDMADLYTCEAHKDYQAVYTKGRVLPGMRTLPFGYRQRQRAAAEEEGYVNNMGDLLPPQPAPRTRPNIIDPEAPGHSLWFS
jgi:hypothetical protein